MEEVDELTAEVELSGQDEEVGDGTEEGEEVDDILDGKGSKVTAVEDELDPREEMEE